MEIRNELSVDFFCLPLFYLFLKLLFHALCFLTSHSVESVRMSF
jgi:hypothetical protein